MTSCAIGIDPSLARTGLYVLRGDEAYPHSITSKGQRSDTWLDRALRIDSITQQVYKLLEYWAGECELVLIEGPSYSSAGSGTWDRAGLWWHVFWTVGDAGLGVPVIVSPSQRITYAVGKGGGKGADKDSVLAATVRRYTAYDVGNNDEADALLLAAMGVRHLGDPVEESLPKTHLAALDKIDWSGR